MAKSKGGDTKKIERKDAQEMLARVAEELDKLKKMGVDAPEATSRYEAARARFEDGGFHEAEMLAGEAVLMAKAMREMAAISVSVSQKEESERRAVRKQVIREVGEQLTALMSGPLSPERIRAQAMEAAEGYFKKAVADEFAREGEALLADADGAAKEAVEKAAAALSSDAQKAAKAEAAAAVKALLEDKKLLKLIGEIAKAEASAATEKLPKVGMEDVSKAVNAAVGDVKSEVGKMPALDEKDVLGILKKPVETALVQMTGKIKVATDALASKLQPQIAGLKEAMGAVEVPSGEEIDEQIEGAVAPALAQLRSEFEARGEELTTRVQTAVDELTSQVDASLTEVTSAIDAIEVPTPEEIESRIDGKVSPAVATVRSELASRGDELSQSVENSVAELTSQVDSALSEVRTALGSLDVPGPEEVASQIDAKVAAASEELVDKVNAAIRSLTARVDGAVESVNVRMDGLPIPSEDDIREVARAQAEAAASGVPTLSDEDIERIAGERISQALGAMEQLTSEDVRSIVEEAVAPRLSSAINEARAEVAGLTERVAGITVPSTEDIEAVAADVVERATGSLRAELEEREEAVSSRVDGAVANLTAQANSAVEELTSRVDKGLEETSLRVDAIRTLTPDEVRSIVDGVVAELPRPLTGEEVSSIASGKVAKATAELMLSGEFAERVADLAPEGLVAEEVGEIARAQIADALERSGFATAGSVSEMIKEAVEDVVSRQMGAVDVAHVAGRAVEEALAAANPVTEEQARSIAENAAVEAAASAAMSQGEIRSFVQEAVAHLKGELLSGEELSGMVARLASERATAVIAETPRVTPKELEEKISRSVSDFSRAVLDSRELADMISLAVKRVDTLSEDQVREIAAEMSAGALAETEVITPEEARKIAAEEAAAASAGLAGSAELTDRFEGLLESKAVEMDERIKAAVDGGGQPGLAPVEIDQIVEGRIHQEIDRLIDSEALANTIKRVAGEASLQMDEKELALLIEKNVERAAAEGIGKDDVAAMIESALAEAGPGAGPAKDEIAVLVQEAIGQAGGGESLGAQQVDEIVEGRIQMEIDRAIGGEMLAERVKELVGQVADAAKDEAIEAARKAASELGAQEALAPAEVKEIVHAEADALVRRALSSDEFQAAVIDLIPDQPEAGGAPDSDTIKMVVTETLAERLRKIQEEVIPRVVEKTVKPMIKEAMSGAAKGAPKIDDAQLQILISQYADAKIADLEAKLGKVAQLAQGAEGGVDAAQVQAVAQKVADAKGAELEKKLLQVAQSLQAGAGGGGVEEAQVQAIAAQVAEAKTAELEERVKGAMKAMATDGGGGGGGGGGGPVDVTPDLINKIANSDAFLKMLENRFRVMAEYLKTDVIPKEFKKLSG